MIGITISFLLGVLVASVVWFFVWKNNKTKFTKVLEELESKTKYINSRL